MWWIFSSPHPLPLLSPLGGLPYEFKVVIAGNHELTFDKDFMAELVKQDYYRFPSVSKLKPEDFDNVQTLLTNCVYLQDSDVTIKGLPDIRSAMVRAAKPPFLSSVQNYPHHFLSFIIAESAFLCRCVVDP